MCVHGLGNVRWGQHFTIAPNVFLFDLNDIAEGDWCDNSIIGDILLAVHTMDTRCHCGSGPGPLCGDNPAAVSRRRAGADQQSQGTEKKSVGLESFSEMVKMSKNQYYVLNKIEIVLQ